MNEIILKKCDSSNRFEVVTPKKTYKMCYYESAYRQAKEASQIYKLPIKIIK